MQRDELVGEFVARDNGKEHGNYCSIYRGSIGTMEKKMETTMV